MLSSSFFISFVILCVTSIQCARILGYFSFPSISHQVVYQPIWKELSLRGHDVTVLTPDPLRDKSLLNLTEIDLSSSYDLVQGNGYILQEIMYKDLPQRTLYTQTFSMVQAMYEYQLELPQVQNFIKDRTRQFDVVLVEGFHPIPYALGTYFQAPVIGVASLNFFPNSHRAVGNPYHPVLNPNALFTRIYENMDLYDRIKTVLFVIWFEIWYRYCVLPEADVVVKKHFGGNMPFVGDIERNMSMMFRNVNPIVNAVQADVPAVIKLGSMHLKRRKPLQPDLKQILDDAKEGVIYFSLGSNVKSKDLPLRTQTAITQALAELPFKVLWKWETNSLPNQPKNVIIRKWFPQQDLLGHPNIKAFVTQGGLQSLEEAIINSVPIVGLPFIADQPMSVQKLSHLGAGLFLDPTYFTKEDLKKAVMEVATNPQFKLKMQELSETIRDEPMSGLERAVWWTEYVIRHKGAKYLRCPSADIPLYKYLLLDVIVVVLFGFLSFFYIIYKIVCVSFKRHKIKKS